MKITNIALFVTSAATVCACTRAPSADVPRPAANNAQPPATFRVDSPAREELLHAGEDAPRFRVTAHDGRVIESAGSRARPLVVYFYPRDETPGCTVEAQGFRDNAREFEAAGVDVVGVSTDSNDRHRDFSSHHHLGFALVSDPDARLAQAFGVRVRMGFAQRVTFVVNKAGQVIKVFESVTPDGHATEVLTIARAP